MLSDPDLHLSSSSPRRRDILTSMGLTFSYAGADIDEAPQPNESAIDLVQRLACSKALAACNAREFDIPVLGADTVVVVDERILGKPQSREEALEMLGLLSARTHKVLTAIAVCSKGAVDTALSSTEVEFREISPDEARRYWQSGESSGKAGGYAIQGLAGVFVKSLRGSYSGVVGLPVYETAMLLRRAGVDALIANAGGQNNDG